MRPLPAQRYHHRVLKLAKVSRVDCHVQFGKETVLCAFTACWQASPRLRFCHNRRDIVRTASLN